jgi:NADPH:quinone reductase
VKAFALDAFAQPGSIREMPEPVPAPGQVKVRVAASSLNPFDNSVMLGRMDGRMEHRFPLIPGSDASGTVESLGEGVTSFSVGDDVFGVTGKPYLGEGTLADHVTMAAATITRKPASLDHESAAAIPVAGVTALVMADALELSDGDVVVTNGATGGVGSYLIQIASRRGAHVVAVSSAPNADYARSLGAAETIDYAAGDLVEAVRSAHPDGIDAVADMHSVEGLISRLSDVIRTGGRVASAVGSADVDALAAKGITATNVYGAVDTARLEQMVSMFESKEIVSPELQRFPFGRMADALDLLASGHVRGKIIVTPG